MKKFLALLMFASVALHAQADKVKFSAVIKNPNSDSLVIRSRTFSKVLKTKKPGIFNSSFAIETGFYQIFDGTEQTSLFLKNGYDIAVTLDAKQFDETITYKGKGQKENNILAKLAIDMERLSESIANATPEEQNKAITAKLDEFNALLKDQNLDQTFRTAMEQQIQGQKQQLEMMAQQAALVSKLKGQPSPLFNYENHKGGTTKLESLKGKYVYIDVWATWCGPCRQEIPFLQKVEERYHGKNIEFVSISIDVAKDHEKWKKFVTDKSLGGIQLFADADWKSAFTQAYGINSIPRFLLIDPQGNVVDADAKRPSDPALQTQLDGLVK
ncbi:TlpA family protein disulfide reductase [Flavobacterium psychrotrophum]|uniref:TlpA family protein disulfide reductase n=1 Tax=Flavobacterium psychrotrophum TaxID=2294119 RepID=UPI000E31211F|nr:TlpA disulfide reductase family protein [Flavobacterium psychrotrophum]